MKSIFRWDRGIFKKIEEGPIVYFVFLSRYIASDLILEFSFIVEFSKIRVTENYFFSVSYAYESRSGAALASCIKELN